MLLNVRRSSVAAALMLATVGCGSPDQAEPDAPPVASELVAQNGFTFNGFTFNGFTFNGFTFNGFTFNGFTFNGFTFNGLAADESLGRWNALSPRGLRDPATHALASYVVSCALPAGDSVTYSDAGGTFTFPGSLGLAPEWKSDSCGLECQRWISACLVARSNASGQHVAISVRGPSDALKLVKGEAQSYPVREATYYGNMFGERPALFACLPKGVTVDPRVCGPSLSDCPMNIVGSCEDVCHRPGPNGTSLDCAMGSDGLRDASSENEDRKGGLLFRETVTVFLAR